MKKFYIVSATVSLLFSIATYICATQTASTNCPLLSYDLEALTACEASAMCPNNNSMIRCSTNGDGNCTSGINSAGQTYVQCGGNIAVCN